MPPSPQKLSGAAAPFAPPDVLATGFVVALFVALDTVDDVAARAAVLLGAVVVGLLAEVLPVAGAAAVAVVAALVALVALAAPQALRSARLLNPKAPRIKVRRVGRGPAVIRMSFEVAMIAPLLRVLPSNISLVRLYYRRCKRSAQRVGDLSLTLPAGPYVGGETVGCSGPGEEAPALG